MITPVLGCDLVEEFGAACWLSITIQAEPGSAQQLMTRDI